MLFNFYFYFTHMGVCLHVYLQGFWGVLYSPMSSLYFLSTLYYQTVIDHDASLPSRHAFPPYNVNQNKPLIP